MKQVLAILILCSAMIAGSAIAKDPAIADTTATVQDPTSLAFLPSSAVVREILAQQPSVERAGALLNSAKADARARRAGPHEFTVNGEYVSREIQQDGRYNEWSAGVSRAIRLPGKAGADEHIGELGVDVAGNSYEDARHQAALTLKNLWIAWLSAEGDTVLANAEVENYRLELAATERRRQLGEAATLDVEQVQAALAQARVQAARVQQVRQEAEMTLRRTFPGLILPATPPRLPEPSTLEGTWDEWQKAVVDNSHEIRMAQSEADRRQWLARRARLDRYADPTVGLRMFQERGGRETGFGINVSIPIGGALREAESDSLNAQAVAAAVDARKVRRDVEINANRDALQARLGLDAWRQSAEAMKNSKQVLVRMQRAVALGEHGLTELLIAQRQDFDIRRNEAQTRAMAQSAILQLLIDSHRIWGLGDE